MKKVLILESVLLCCLYFVKMILCYIKNDGYVLEKLFMSFGIFCNSVLL